MSFIVSEEKIEYEENGKVLAEVCYPTQALGIVDIVHTFVDPSLRGRGMADKLMQHAADELRQSGRKAVPSCSYAAKWFNEHREYADILA